MKRHRNHGLRKVCSCGWRKWPKCPHSWYLNFTPRGGPLYRFSLDAELGRRIENKAEAEREAERIKTAIRNREFVRAADKPQATPSQPVTSDPAVPVTTVEQFAEAYVSRVAQFGLKGQGTKVSWKNDRAILKRLCAFRRADGQALGVLPVCSITEAELETFFASLGSFAASSRNSYVQVIKAAFRWALRRGYVPSAVISEDTTIRRGKVAQRRRRLLPGEESALLAAAGAAHGEAGHRLQWLIIAALETGCRRGELLALRWADVSLEKRAVLVRAVEQGAKKTAQSRELPMSGRLAATLEMVKTDAKARCAYGPLKYVFGDTIGNKIGSTKRAWETAVLKAHGHAPIWMNQSLAAASRAALQAIDLEFRDLRHECGCRWLEAGVPLHHIQEMLGHANLSQTSTYLHASEFGLAESMRRFDDARGKPEAKEPEPEPPLVCQDAPEETPKSQVH